MSQSEQDFFNKLVALSGTRSEQELAEMIAADPVAKAAFASLTRRVNVASYQEEVIEGRVGSDYMVQFGNAKPITEDKAVVTVTISSPVRQVGKTALTACIADALRKKGYTNVELVPAYQMTEKNYEFIDDELFAHHLAKNRGIKVKVIDEPLWLDK